MAKFIVTSPTFSEFRAWEPLAFRIASKAVRGATTSQFVDQIKGEDPKYGRYDVKVVAKKDTIEVFLHKDEEPFVFHLEEI